MAYNAITLGRARGSGQHSSINVRVHFFTT